MHPNICIAEPHRKRGVTIGHGTQRGVPALCLRWVHCHKRLTAFMASFNSKTARRRGNEAITARMRSSPSGSAPGTTS